MEFNDLLNEICGELPEGYQIIIECENGYGGVKLLIPGSDAEIEAETDCEHTIEDSALELINVAKSGKYN